MNENEIGGIVVDCAIKVHITYLRLSGGKVGYLMNFGGALMKDGISRIINGKLE